MKEFQLLTSFQLVTPPVKLASAQDRQNVNLVTAVTTKLLLTNVEVCKV